MRIDMSRKLEMEFGGWVGEGDAIFLWWWWWWCCYGGVAVLVVVVLIRDRL